MTLAEKRTRAARAALRAHHERKNPPSRHLTDKTRMDPAKNPDLESDFVDLIADSLLAAKAVGLDPARIARMAISHVPGAE